MSGSHVEGAAERERVGPGLRLAMLMRSFFLQAVWNPKGMQAVGFCFAMLPIIGRWRNDDEGRREFLSRHLAFFNTNPALATYAIGAAASAELSGAPEEAVELKRALGGPLGMAGDSLFWGALRPLAALVGVALVVAGRPWAPLGFLAVYNVPHLCLRARGISSGSLRRAASVSEVVGPGVRRSVAFVRAAGAFVAGLLLALAIRGVGGIDFARFVVAAVLLALAFAAVRLRVPATVVGLAASLGGVALMLAGSGGGPS